jgi:hypothetical protein
MATDDGGRKRKRSRSKSPLPGPRRAPSPIADWDVASPGHISRADWRGSTDHLAKFKAFASIRSLKLNPDCNPVLKGFPDDLILKIWWFYQDLDEGSETCRDWPEYCGRKWGRGSHERSLNLSEAEQSKRMNWLHRVMSPIFEKHCIVYNDLGESIIERPRAHCVFAHYG